ncbi:hypothetical protein ABVK25_004626 [Lepraria finkii]|uniref:Uncharacterized protein n=1 Tax=Lepraria finkii TaxID=1340010 RepID=A0ABR4BBQ8_9LECA
MTVSYILEILEKLKSKLKIAGSKPIWIEQASSTGRLRLEYEMKRVTYTSSCKRREKVISHLEKHNAEILMLLGNSEKLVPMRKKRKSPVTKYFRQIRSQAQNLHTVLNRAWQCEDSSAHSSKFLLEKRLKFDENSSPEIEDPSINKFNVFFCYEPQKRASMSTLVSSPSDWCATEIKMLDAYQDLERQRSRSADLGSRPSLLETSSQHRSNTSSGGSNASDNGGRRVAFVGSDAPSATLFVLDDAPEISDLCSILQKRMSHRSSIGYLKDPHERRHSVSLVENLQPPAATFLTNATSRHSG